MNNPSPLPAATVVLARSTPDGFEVLLTRRPSTMAFAADMHVFPGGRVDAGDSDPRIIAVSSLTPTEAAVALGDGLDPAAAHAAHVAAIRELFEESGVLLADGSVTPDDREAARAGLLAGRVSLAEVVGSLGLRLRLDLLHPIAHWATPPIMPRRFDTRFFLAELPAEVEPSFDTAEVVSHRWLTPRAGLEAMAAGDLEMWVPTSATLQQLVHARSTAEVRGRVVLGREEAPRVVDLTPGVGRIEVSRAGAVPGQSVNTYLVGRREIVVIDPGDPSDRAADAILDAVRAASGRIAAVVLTHPDPDHAAGAEALSLRLQVPIFAGSGAGRELPYDITELADDELVPVGDVPLHVVNTPGPRPDHIALMTREGSLLMGDLVGARASRAILAPPDEGARARSLVRLAELGPRRLFPGHGEPLGHEALSSVTRPRRFGES